MVRSTLKRLALDESGMTLLELLIVAQLLAILTSIAVPTYLQSRDNAYKATASANVKALVIAADLYQADNWPGSLKDPDAAISTADSGFSGMTIPELKTYDSSISTSSEYVNNSGTEAGGVTARATLDATNFCIYAQAGRWFAYQLDETGPITTTTDASAVCT